MRPDSAVRSYRPASVGITPEGRDRNAEDAPAQFCVLPAPNVANNISHDAFTIHIASTDAVSLKARIATGVGRVSFLSSNTALAQSCPPGYFVIGGTGANGCASMSNGGSSAPQPRQYENEGVPTLQFSERAKGDTFIAVAWHPNANDGWAIWGN